MISNKEEIKLALEDLDYARNSHLAWAEHLEDHGIFCKECDDKPYKLDSKHEREWVEKYDRIIKLVKSIV